MFHKIKPKNKMMTHIKSFEDACKKLGISTAVPVVDGLPENHQKAIIAHYKLVIIAEALNEGWNPDWSNDDERKYCPWFDMGESVKHPSGSGLSYDDYVNWYTASRVGSRLCFRTSELAKYAGTEFSKLYEEYFLIR